MKKYPCELIEDIMPLYMEGDIQPKTKEVVEEHLEECNNCTDLLKEYSVEDKFMQVLHEGKETLPEVSTFKGWMGKLKHGAVYLAIFVVIVAALVGAISYRKGAGEYNNMVRVKSEEQLKKRIYQSVPGLKRAEEEGNVFHINKSVDIIMDNGEKGKFVLDKVWYVKDRTYLFYHTDLGAPEAIDGGVYIGDSRLGIFGGSANEIILYNGQYYGKINCTFDYEKNLTKGIENKLRLETKLLYNVYGQKKSKGILTAKASDINFSIKQTDMTEKVYRYNLNKELNLGEGRKITFKELNLDIDESYLLVQYISEKKEEVAYFWGQIVTDNGAEINFHKAEKDDNNLNMYKVRFNAIDNIPKSITVKISDIRLKTTDNLKFSLPLEEFSEEIKNWKRAELNDINRKLKENSNMEYYLERLHFTDNAGEDDYLYINIEEKYKDKEYYSRVRPQPIMPRRLIDYKEEISSDFKGIGANLVNIKNGKGEEPKWEDHDNFGVGPEDEMWITISKSFVQGSKSLEVEISNLSKNIFGNWEINIDIDK